jgi:hypothetical protein
MKTILALMTIAVALCNLCLAQTSENSQNPGLTITNGPVVENVTDATAQVAWSTNVSSSTILHYGTDPDNLNGVASMPWGALTHRVQLKNLKPGTTYYFRAESGQGQGTGNDVRTAEFSFQTKSPGQQSETKKSENHHQS